MSPDNLFEARRAHLISLHTAGGWDMVARWTMEPKWQPIETAPEVGEYWVYLPGERSKTQICQSWLNAVGRPLRTIGGLFAFDMETHPTHWQPSPNPRTPEGTEVTDKNPSDLASVAEKERVARCPSTHCERRGECCSPHDCIIKPKEPT